MQTIASVAALRNLAALLLCFACNANGAPTAYRCAIGSRTVYQASPCEGGVPLQVEDKRSEAQRAEALQTQERLASTGARMQREKEARDRALGVSAPRIKQAATPQTTTGKDSVQKRQNKPTAPLKFKVPPPAPKRPAIP